MVLGMCVHHTAHSAGSAGIWEPIYPRDFSKQEIK